MPYLAFNLNDGNEFVFDIFEGRLSIGRDSKNEIVIDNTYISSFHAELVWKSEGSYELIDLKSANGTYVNGQRIERCEVKSGDKIRFGQLDAQFRDHASKDAMPADAPSQGAISTNMQTPSDSRRGDTEAIPVRDLSSTAASPIDLKKSDIMLAKAESPMPHPSHDRDATYNQAKSSLHPHRESEELLNSLRTEVQLLKKELQALSQDKLTTSAALERVQSDRNAASAQLESLRAEYSTLQKILSEAQLAQEAAQKAQQTQADQAEARLKELNDKAATAEKRAAELADVQKQLSEAQAIFQETEKLRQHEEQALAGLTKQQETFKKELITLEQRIHTSRLQMNELANQVKVEEIRATEIRAHLEKATTALHTAESQRNEAETAAASAREEDTALRKSIPAMQTQLAELQAALNEMTREHDEASQYVTRLNLGTDESQKKITSLQHQISQLEEAQRLREERLMKAQADVDTETIRLKTTQEKIAEAETALNAIEKELRETRSRAEASRAQVNALDADLKARLDQIESLKLEETRLSRLCQCQSNDIDAAQTALDEIQDKTRREENRLSDLSQTLIQSAERELALHAKVNALQETCVREQTRLEEIRKEQLIIECTLGSNHADGQHKHLAELNRQIQNQHAQIERLNNEISTLKDRRAEFALAESQIKHWQEIEFRMRNQLLELEEKHEIMRRSLSLHEGTVIAFSHDIIQRMDLIDELASQYSLQNRSDIVDPLLALKASFEDTLLKHGITPIKIAIGTGIDPDLKHRIAIVDSIPGKGQQRVVQTCRVGYAYSREEGHELILRKLEVKTSSH